ncbi:hypothetical protein B0J14DRAFT_98953 [Halenospora varia]|nr:hypothetical protein B0J14DRAFT_98953 [Halenospora varia]
MWGKLKNNFLRNRTNVSRVSERPSEPQVTQEINRRILGCDECRRKHEIQSQLQARSDSVSDSSYVPLAKKHAPPAKGTQETITMIAMMESKSAVKALKQSKSKALNTMRREPECPEDSFNKGKLLSRNRHAEEDLERSAQFWENAHKEHTDLHHFSPRNCPSCKNVGRMLTDPRYRSQTLYNDKIRCTPRVSIQSTRYDNVLSQGDENNQPDLDIEIQTVSHAVQETELEFNPWDSFPAADTAMKTPSEAEINPLAQEATSHKDAFTSDITSTPPTPSTQQMTLVTELNPQAAWAEDFAEAYNADTDHLFEQYERPPARCESAPTNETIDPYAGYATLSNQEGELGEQKEATSQTSLTSIHAAAPDDSGHDSEELDPEYGIARSWVQSWGEKSLETSENDEYHEDNALQLTRSHSASSFGDLQEASGPLESESIERNHFSFLQGISNNTFQELEGLQLTLSHNSSSDFGDFEEAPFQEASPSPQFGNATSTPAPELEVSDEELLNNIKDLQLARFSSSPPLSDDSSEDLVSEESESTEDFTGVYEWVTENFPVLNSQGSRPIVKWDTEMGGAIIQFLKGYWGLSPDAPFEKANFPRACMNTFLRDDPNALRETFPKPQVLGIYISRPPTHRGHKMYAREFPPCRASELDMGLRRLVLMCTKMVEWPITEAEEFTCESDEEVDMVKVRAGRSKRMKISRGRIIYSPESNSSPLAPQEIYEMFDTCFDAMSGNSGSQRDKVSWESDSSSEDALKEVLTPRSPAEAELKYCSKIWSNMRFELLVIEDEPQ